MEGIPTTEKAQVWQEGACMEGGAWGSLPGSSRAWLYTADRVLKDEEQKCTPCGYRILPHRMGRPRSVLAGKLAIGRRTLLDYCARRPQSKRHRMLHRCQSALVASIWGAMGGGLDEAQHRYLLQGRSQRVERSAAGIVLGSAKSRGGR